LKNRMIISRVKWHWLAGGASILVFLILLALRLNLFNGPSSPFATPSTPQLQASTPKESWMAISQNGRPIGYAHRQIALTDQGYRLEETVSLRINTMGVVQGISFKTDSDLNPDMSLSSFNFKLQSNLFHFSLQGIVKKETMLLRYRTGGEEKTAELSLKETPQLANNILDTAWGLGLKPGQSRTFQAFDPTSLGQRAVTVSMMDEETITVGGVSHRARKVSMDFMGARQYAWIDRNGDVLREEGIMGITMEKATREQAMSAVTSSGSADLTEIVSIGANIQIPEPPRLSLLTVKLSGTIPGSLDLGGDRQTYHKGTLTIQKEATDGTVQPPRPVGNKADFIKATPFIQARDYMIRQKAKEIVAPGDTPRIKAEKIVNWVYRNIEKRPVLSIPNARDTLINRIGDCNEHAVLVAALARAAGIPAQIEAGLVYQKGRFYYHAWNVLFTDRWITADAVMNQMPADVTHIRLIRGDADRQLDLMGVIGNLKLEIIRML
jgi:hypothetical protein